MKFSMYEDVYIVGCNNFNTAIADGEFPASGSYIDVSDFMWCAFLIRVGTLDSALTCQVQQAATISSTAKDLTDCKWVVGTGDGNKWGVVEFEPRKLDINNGYNYVTLDVTGAGGSNDYLDIFFLGFGKGVRPVTQHASFDTSAIIAG